MQNKQYTENISNSTKGAQSVWLSRKDSHLIYKVKPYGPINYIDTYVGYGVWRYPYLNTFAAVELTTVEEHVICSTVKETNHEHLKMTFVPNTFKLLADPDGDYGGYKSILRFPKKSKGT